MAKKKSAREIVQEAMPNVEVMPPLPQAAMDEAMSTAVPGSPSIQELKAKYLGSVNVVATTTADDVREEPNSDSRLAELRRRFLGSAADSPSSSANAATDDVEIVRVKSRTGEDSPESGPGVRTVIVSKSKGKIIGKQG